MNADITAIEKQTIITWLTPIKISRLAVGINTLSINCQLVHPLIRPASITSGGIALKPKIVSSIIGGINDFMIGMFRGVGIKLIDFKLEFGRLKANGKDEVILADEISPDTCRLWDSITDKKLDKDRFRKNLGDLIPAYTEVAKRLGILHEQSNVSAVNVTKLSSVKRKRK